jgi:hypothetical protein
MLKRYVILGIVAAALLAAWGCTDRGTNIPTTSFSRWELDPRADHVFDTLLALQIRNLSQLLLSSAYIPKEALPQNGGYPVPTLVLLAPEEQDKYFYFNHGLLDILQEMTQSGEIQPMVVLCVGNDPVFGGYWYGNSAPAGYYDGIIAAPGDSGLPKWLANFIPTTINDKSKRGIGGVGTGAYGAFRAILKHPGVYSSISVTDGPLDFDGPDGNSGLVPLFKVAMDDQYALRRPGRLNVKFDSLTPSPISRILLGGAFAFSPEDTSVRFTYTPNGTQTDVIITITDSLQTADTAALVLNLVASGKVYHMFNPIMPFYIDSAHAEHLPGDIYAPAWARWMHNNLDSLYDAAGETPLAGVNMFFATSTQSPHNYYPMTQSWITSLKDKGLTSQITELKYSGAAGIPSGNDQFLYDLLKKMVKFHSDNFGK